MPPQPRRPSLPEWCRLELRFVTPAFIGGATPRYADRDLPVRPSAIRGALRHWLRLALTTVLGGAGNQDRRAALRDLRYLEAELFGAVGFGDGGAQASRVLIQPPQGGKVVPVKAPNHGTGLRYLGYGLFDAKDVEQKPPTAVFTGEDEPVRLAVGLRFRSADSDERRKAMWDALGAALYLWGTMGGLGARTRRGWGAVELRFAADGEPTGEHRWAQLLKAPASANSREVARTLGQGIRFALTLVARYARVMRVQLPDFPEALPEVRGVGGLQEVAVMEGVYPTGDRALDAAGQAFRDFRNTLSRGSRGQGPLPDYGVVKGLLTHGPRGAAPIAGIDRAAFGLPLRVVYRSLGGRTLTVYPQPPRGLRFSGRVDRMPSGLLFRPTRLKDRQVVVMLLDFDKGRAPLGGCTLRLQSGRDEAPGAAPSPGLVQQFIQVATRPRGGGR